MSFKQQATIKEFIPSITHMKLHIYKFCTYWHPLLFTNIRIDLPIDHIISVYFTHTHTHTHRREHIEKLHKPKKRSKIIMNLDSFH